MHLIQEFSEQSRELASKIEAAFEQLVSNWGAGTDDILPAQSSMSLMEHFENRLSVITEGTLTVSIGEKPVMFLSEGDIFGFPWERLVCNLSLQTDFAVKYSYVSLDEFYSEVNGDSRINEIWSVIQASYAALWLLLFSENSGELDGESPGIRFYEPGEIILQQGDKADEVYTLVEGAAEVFHDDVQVGIVGEDEIFGALASLTGTTRTASVKALQRCTVATLPVQSFKTIIQTRPHTAEKLISDFAKKIVQLNKRIAQD